MGKQLLHLVIGGELNDVADIDFRDMSKIDFVGAYPNYADAKEAWKSAAQRSVDNAHMRYFVIHAHRLLDKNGASKCDEDI
jgi:myo-inositol-1(or 4)-monophosphatase